MEFKIFTEFSQIPGYDSLIDQIPIFALPVYSEWLKIEKGFKTFWFYGDNGNSSRWLIPFSVMKRGCFKKGMFLTETLCLSENNIEEEKRFLNIIIDSIRKDHIVDWIQQSPNWAIFKTCPEDAISVPFGSYYIDLKSYSEEELFMRIQKRKRQYIRKAMRGGIEIKQGIEYISDIYKLISHTCITAGLSLPELSMFRLMHENLQNNILSYIAYYNGIPQSSLVLLVSGFCIYTQFAGTISAPISGSSELLYWHAIQRSKEMNIRFFDFTGALIDPDPGSKDEGIQKFKENFGADLKKGFIWKYSISKVKYQSYLTYINLQNKLKHKSSKIDIIDRELERLKSNGFK